jgi:hypothetical protein
MVRRSGRLFSLQTIETTNSKLLGPDNTFEDEDDDEDEDDYETENMVHQVL